MTKHEAILEIKNKIKALLSGEEVVETTETVEVQLNAYETVDGSKYECDGELMVGSPIYKMDENGNRNVVENGEYEFTNGLKVSVMDGMVSEISSITEEETDTEESIVENPVETEAGKKKKESEMEVKVNELETKLAELTNIISTLVNETEGISTKLTELSNQPAAQSIVYERNLSVDELRVEKMKQIRDGLKK
jgi:hypothetical protein